MKQKTLHLITGIAFFMILIGIAFATRPAQAASTSSLTAYDLIAGVNQLRLSNGLNELSANNLLMIAAQSHSEYQASLGYWTHQGSGGSTETDRAMAVGYGNGASVACDEAVAIASSTKDID